MGKKSKQRTNSKPSSSSSSSSSSAFSPPPHHPINDSGGISEEQREWLSSQLGQIPPDQLQQFMANMIGMMLNQQQLKSDDEEDDEEDIPYNMVRNELLETQRKEELGLIEKKRTFIDDKAEYPIKEPMNWDKFFKADYPVGFYKLIDNNTFIKIVQDKMKYFGLNSVCDENCFYYHLLGNTVGPFGQDARRFMVVQKLRKEGDNPRANMRPETYEYYPDMDFKVCPSVEYLKKVITQKFIPKEKQDSKDDILEDKELVRCAKFVINSKKRRKKEFEESTNSPWSEAFDTNTLDTNDYDTDSNDPENKLRLSERELDTYKFYKTEGARIKRLLIGSWSPCPCYDEQFRIKISPLFRKIYYRFFTFLPSYHNNFKDEQERDKYFSILTKAISSSNALSQYLQNEMERLTNSTILSMEIDYSSITGIHLQKCYVDQRVFKEELCLLVLQVNQPPTFYSRKVNDGYIRNMDTKKRDDFTDGCAASTSSRHYICGSEREMKRIASILIQSDTTGTLRNLYREGMKNIDLENGPVELSGSVPLTTQPVTATTSSSSSSTSNNPNATRVLSNYKLSTDKKVLGECIYSHLTANFTQHLWEKLLTTPVTEASNQTGIDLRNRGYSEIELSDLKLYQILGNEKFNDIYFSFCKGRFYKTSEYHHVNGKCCSVNTKPIQEKNITETITTTQSSNQVTKSETKKPITGTPFKFVNIGSVVEYPLPPSFPPYKKK